VGRASANPGALLRGSAFGTSDSVVIDRRGLPSEQRQAIALTIAQSRLTCRVLCIDGPAQEARPLQNPSSDVSLGADESPAAYAAAVHHGLGRHDLLIEAMHALMSSLTPLGLQFVSEALCSRFLFARVATIAEQLGVQRTRLHHRLVDAGDPPPKRLLDACYAMTTALILRDPMLGTNDLLTYLRAKELRTPRDAVYRCTGMDLASLRRLAQRDWGQHASSLIAWRLLGNAATWKTRRLRAVPPRTSSSASDVSAGVERIIATSVSGAQTDRNDGRPAADSPRV